MSDVKLKELVINECSSVPSTFEPNQLYLTPDTTEEDIANALKQAKEYTDSREQDVRTDFMESDTALQTQITGLSDALDEEKGKIVAIESKVPTTASSSNLLTTATDLLNATQDVRSDFAEADSELQTQITGLSGTVAENKSDITNLKSQKYGADLSYTEDNLQLLDQDGKPIGSAVEIKASGGSSNDLFDHKWADHILNDISWLRADTFSWQNGEFYKSAYEHLVEDFNNTSSNTETIGSNTITYYQAEDGHKIVLPDQESSVQAIYEETGVAWYYILDTTNKRFKLPRELPITDKVKGNGMTLGLTDGTNNLGLGNYNVSNVGLYAPKAAYGKEIGFQSGNFDSDTGTLTIGITTDPTKSGIISHRENENGQQYLYFYVGNYTKSAVEQTAGITTEVLNDKLDTDFGNATATTKETVVGWGMPDYSAGVSISLPYTCPSCGFITITYTSTRYTTDVFVNGISTGDQGASNADVTNTSFLFCKKGDVVSIGGNYSYNAKFFPLIGG